MNYYEDFFTVNVTAVNIVDDVPSYTFTEVEFDFTASSYVDVVSPRSGSSTGTSNLVEMNNTVLSTFPFVAHAKYKGLVGGVTIYEFDRNYDPGDGASLTVSTATVDVSTDPTTDEIGDVSTLEVAGDLICIRDDDGEGIPIVDLAIAPSYSVLAQQETSDEDEVRPAWVSSTEVGQFVVNRDDAITFDKLKLSDIPPSETNNQLLATIDDAVAWQGLQIQTHTISGVDMVTSPLQNFTTLDVASDLFCIRNVDSTGVPCIDLKNQDSNSTLIQPAGGVRPAWIASTSGQVLINRSAVLKFDKLETSDIPPGDDYQVLATVDGSSEWTGTPQVETIELGVSEETAGQVIFDNANNDNQFTIASAPTPTDSTALLLPSALPTDANRMLTVSSVADGIVQSAWQGLTIQTHTISSADIVTTPIIDFMTLEVAADLLCIRKDETYGDPIIDLANASSLSALAQQSGGVRPAWVTSTSDNTFLARRSGVIVWAGLTSTDIPPVGPAPSTSPTISATAGNEENVISITLATGSTNTYLYRGSSSSVTSSTGTLIYSSTGTSYTDTGLTNYTTYYYVGYGWNSGVFGPASSVVSATPTAFGAPSISVSAGNAQNVISITLGSSSTDTYIYRGLTSSVNSSTGTLVYSGSGTSYTDTGLTNGTTYYYAPYAYGSSTLGPEGSVQSGTPTAPSVARQYATGTTSGTGLSLSVTVDWPEATEAGSLLVCVVGVKVYGGGSYMDIPSGWSGPYSSGGLAGIEGYEIVFFNSYYADAPSQTSVTFTLGTSFGEYGYYVGDAVVICAEYTGSQSTQDYSTGSGSVGTASTSDDINFTPEYYGTAYTNYNNELWVFVAMCFSGATYSEPTLGFAIGAQAAISGSTSVCLCDYVYPTAHTQIGINLTLSESNLWGISSCSYY